MKLILLTTIVALVLVGCRPSEQVEYKLSGKWMGKGYTCWDDDGKPVTLDELVSISHKENQVVATKITGDNCVEEGEITWKGQITGNTIVGNWFGLNNFTKQKVQFPAKFKIVSNDYFYAVDGGAPVKFHRVKEQ